MGAPTPSPTRRDVGDVVSLTSDRQGLLGTAFGFSQAGDQGCMCSASGRFVGARHGLSPVDSNGPDDRLAALIHMNLSSPIECVARTG